MDTGCPFKFKCPEIDKLSPDEYDCCDNEYFTCKIYQLYLKEEIKRKNMGDFYGRGNRF